MGKILTFTRKQNKKKQMLAPFTWKSKSQQIVYPYWKKSAFLMLSLDVKDAKYDT